MYAYSLCTDGSMLYSTPEVGLKRNSDSVTIATTADPRPIPETNKKMSICKVPAISEPDPVEVEVS